MLRNAILAVSIVLNGPLAYMIFQPVSGPANSRMTCEQARSDIDNKRAVGEYADGNGSSFSKVHSFLKNSDYELRNVSIDDGKLAFVYTSSAFYPSTCGIHLPGIDGGIVRIGTDASNDP